jgi:hypothetical protein
MIRKLARKTDQWETENTHLACAVPPAQDVDTGLLQEEAIDRIF